MNLPQDYYRDGDELEIFIEFFFTVSIAGNRKIVSFRGNLHSNHTLVYNAHNKGDYTFRFSLIPLITTPETPAREFPHYFTLYYFKPTGDERLINHTRIKENMQANLDFVEGL